MKTAPRHRLRDTVKAKKRAAPRYCFAIRLYRRDAARVPVARNFNIGELGILVLTGTQALISLR